MLKMQKMMLLRLGESILVVSNSPKDKAVEIPPKYVLYKTSLVSCLM
jgi:hypothetical protein